MKMIQAKTSQNLFMALCLGVTLHTIGCKTTITTTGGEVTVDPIVGKFKYESATESNITYTPALAPKADTEAGMAELNADQKTYIKTTVLKAITDELVKSKSTTNNAAPTIFEFKADGTIPMTTGSTSKTFSYKASNNVLTVSTIATATESAAEIPYLSGPYTLTNSNKTLTLTTPGGKQYAPYQSANDNIPDELKTVLATLASNSTASFGLDVTKMWKALNFSSGLTFVRNSKVASVYTRQ